MYEYVCNEVDTYIYIYAVSVFSVHGVQVSVHCRCFRAIKHLLSRRPFHSFKGERIVEGISELLLLVNLLMGSAETRETPSFFRDFSIGIRRRFTSLFLYSYLYHPCFLFFTFLSVYGEIVFFSHSVHPFIER